MTDSVNAAIPATREELRDAIAMELAKAEYGGRLLFAQGWAGNYEPEQYMEDADRIIGWVSAVVRGDAR